MLDSLALTALMSFGCLNNTNIIYSNIENQSIIEPATSGAIVGENPINPNKVEDYLVGIGLENITKSGTEEFNVSDISGVLPKNHYTEYEDPVDVDTPLYNAFNREENNQRVYPQHHIGCGVLAAISELYYMAEGNGHGEILSSFTYDELFSFYDEIISSIPVASSNVVQSGINTILDAVPELNTSLRQTILYLVNSKEGSFTLPVTILNGINEFFVNHRLNYFVRAYGDIVPSTMDRLERVDFLKSNLEQGYPVIMWSLYGLDGFDQHYVNIVGYETWYGEDQNGQVRTFTFFKCLFNWSNNYNVKLLDSNMFSNFNISGFIRISGYKHLTIKDTDYDYPCSYNNSATTKIINVGNNTITTKRLRVGYVNHYDNNGVLDEQRLVMSSNRDSFTQAYLAWEFNNNKPLVGVSINLALWRHPIDELFINGQCSFNYYAKTTNGEYELLGNADPLTISYSYPTMTLFQCRPVEYKFYTSFKIEVNCTATSDFSRNLGRIILTNSMFYFAEMF